MIQPKEFAMSDTSDLNITAAQAVFIGELADQRGVTKHLRAQIDRLASVDIHRAGINSWLGFVCEHSTKVAGAIARVQSSNAAAMRAMERLRKAAG
jgi:hypothetical protein